MKAPFAALERRGSFNVGGTSSKRIKSEVALGAEECHCGVKLSEAVVLGFIHGEGTMWKCIKLR